MGGGDYKVFQSLVGRLGTILALLRRCAMFGFQSLVGRLGTCGMSGISSFRSAEFQSLVGRLGT